MANVTDTVTGGVVFDNVSLAADVRSKIVDKDRTNGISFDIVCTETAGLSGTIRVDVCNDISVDSPNWQPLTLSSGSTTVAVSGTTSMALDLDPVRFKYVSLYYTSTAGTGSVKAVSHVCKA